MGGVLVCAETRRGVVRDVTSELLTAAAGLGGPVTVLCLGADPSALAADAILHAEAEHFDPQVHAAAVEQAIQRVAPDWILAPHSADGMAYAPAVAAELGLGFASDVHAVDPIRRGNRMIATLEFDGPAVLALRPGAFTAAAPGSGAPVETIELETGSAEHLGYREPEPGVDITKAKLLPRSAAASARRATSRSSPGSPTASTRPRGLPPRGRRRIRHDRAPGRAVREDGQATCLSRPRHLGRCAARRGHPGRRHDHRRQHRPGRSHLPLRPLRRRRRSPRCGPRPSPLPVTERFVTFNGLRLFVREAGEGDPLLLINGLGGNVQMWEIAQSRLAQGRRTIAFDAPGTGRSRVSPVPLPMPVLALVIGRLLDELGYGRVDVAGYSLGGAIAQQVARTLPDRVRRLALCGTACGWGMAPPEPEPLALITSPLRYFSKRVYRATNHIIDGGERFKDPALKERQASARRSAPPHPIGYAQQLLQGITWSSLHWAGTIEAPTLVLNGACDRLVPVANGVLLGRTIPNSRVHELPGEGHLMLFDPESAALGLLEDFFTCGEASDAWTTGRVVTDEGEVKRALRASRGRPGSTNGRRSTAASRAPRPRPRTGRAAGACRACRWRGAAARRRSRRCAGT